MTEVAVKFEPVDKLRDEINDREYVESLRRQWRGSWFWLLAPDGSPLVVDHTAPDVGVGEGEGEGQTSDAKSKSKRKPKPKGRNSSRTIDKTIGDYWTRAGRRTRKRQRGAEWDTVAESIAERTRKRQRRAQSDRDAASVAVRTRKGQRGADSGATEGDPSVSRPSRHRRHDTHAAARKKNAGNVVRADEKQDVIPATVDRKKDFRQGWEDSFQHLVAYKQKEKTTYVPTTTPFGRWVYNQRWNFKNGNLSEERIARLDSIGFEWKLMYRTQQQYKQYEEQWEEQFQRLVAYKQKEKTTNISTTETILGRWVYNQRWVFKNGKLSKERIARLDSIGFEWQLMEQTGTTAEKDSNDCRRKDPTRQRQRWEEKFQRLVAYKQKEKTANVPTRTPLGFWVSTQRRNYRTGTLAKEKIARLESIGFEWVMKTTMNWIEMYDRLVAYKKEHNTTNVHPSKIFKLGVWVSLQRRNYRTGKLKTERISRLESIGFEWQLMEQTDTTDEKDSNDYDDESSSSLGDLSVSRQSQRRRHDTDSHADDRTKAADSDGSTDENQGASPATVDHTSASESESESESARIATESLNPAGLRPLRSCRRKSITDDEHRWEDSFQDLVAYKQKEKTTNISTRATPLGQWVYQQRWQFKDRQLSKEKTARLDSIGFEWKSMDQNRKQWEEQFQHLADYKQKDKTANASVPANTTLRNWVSTQRQIFKKGILSKERIARLDSIGFEWSRAYWMEMYKHLVKYKKKYKTTNVPLRIPKLGRWVIWQRRLYKKGALSQARVAHLESIGFEWQHETKEWIEMYDCLVAYKKKRMITNVYLKTPTIGKSSKAPTLYNWVLQQRQDYMNGILEKERIGLLEYIGFEWQLPGQDWIEIFDRLVAYKQEHKTANVLSKTSNIGKWVSCQRNHYKKGKLSQLKIARLESIGFEWQYETTEWMEMYESLVAYKKEHNDTNVHPKTRNIGQWVSWQRYHYKKGKLAKEKIACLESIGFEWQPKCRSWTEMYSRLVRYKEKYKTSSVLNHYKEDLYLRDWVNEQCHGCKEKHQIDLLNGIGFDWNAAPPRPPRKAPRPSREMQGFCLKRKRSRFQRTRFRLG